MKTPRGVIETCLYVDDLTAARSFYTEVLGACPFQEEAGRHIFLRIGESLLFLFNPKITAHPPSPNEALPVPPHGAHGPGHVAFAVEDDLEDWRAHLLVHNVAIEQTISWPNGARSLYFRDPAGNSLEIATRDLWSDQLSRPPDLNGNARPD